ncbi:MAG TPA: hypothetical protein VFJ16_03580 [Longimicrobium sp.]|nr:hypothetical protein [Longimicrobium sp.]
MASRQGWRLGSWALGGLLLGATLAFLFANIVARTRPGHEWVLGQTLKALGGSIKGGTLVVARVDGNLFEGAKLYGVSLRDRQGRAFIRADSAYAKYDVKTLLAPRIVIDSLTLYHPRIWVFKMPGDSLWNYQAIFADTVPVDTTRPHVERSTALAHVRMVDATVRVETPFRPDTTLSPAARQRQVRGFLSDTGTVIIRQVPGGYVRTVDLARLYGVLTSVRFAPGSELGTTANIDTLRGSVQFYREPIDIRFLRGKFSLPGAEMGSTGYGGYDGLKTGFAEFDIPEARLPGTRLALSGVVRFDNYPRWFNPAQGPMYDIAMRGDSVTFRDFQWLYPKFPANLAGRMNLLIENRPDGLMIDTRNARLHAPGTRINGSFGFILGDTLRFVDVNVDSRPIRVSLIEQMMPDGLPVRGLVLGGVSIRGNNAPARDDSIPIEAPVRGTAAARRDAGTAREPDVADEAPRRAPVAPSAAPARRAPVTPSAAPARRAPVTRSITPPPPRHTDTAQAAAVRRGDARPRR